MHDAISIGTPLIDPYGNRGFVAEIKEGDGNSFVLSGGMRAIRNEYVCCFDNRISELPDGIAAPFIERAKAANLPAIPAEQIATRVAAARQAEADKREALRLAQDEGKRLQAEFEADAKGKIPSWAKAFIVAELIEDKSDSMTDYFGSSTLRSVILGFSSHTRDLFSEMRKLAGNFAETVHLVDAPESAEHREKWSMGAGYYLKTSGRHSSGWQVRKQRFYDSSEPARQLPRAEWSLAAPTAAPAAESANVDGMRIEEHTHTKKGFQMFICIMPERVDRAEFDRLRDSASALGGWYSKPWGRTPGGFAFKDKSKAEAFAGSSASTAERAESEPVAQPETGDKLRGLADAMQGDIDHKLGDRLANTPKRQREAASARMEGYRLQRAQQALRALSAHHDAGTVPAVLARVTSKKTVYDLVGTIIDRSNAGYYDAGIDTGKPATDSPAARALWAMIEGQSAEDRKQEDLRRKVQALQFANIDGYFPTPLPVIEQMIWHADMPAGPFDMLEPEGGSGAILDVVRSRFKSANLTTFERHNSLREVLELKGYALAGSDFMEAEAAPRFDRVLMNPPFEKGQDMEHVRHAFSMLREGGKLVAIMSPGPFFRQDRKATEFRDWFKSLGGEKTDLPAGAFKESGTGTATVLVTISA